MDYKTPAHFEKRVYAIDNPPPEAESFQDYLNAIAYTDSVLEQLVSRMERAGLLENCVLFVMGDHGQGFNEHGRKFHAGCVWEEGTHVPLIVHGPERLLGRPRRIKGLRQNSDLFATVADLLGIDSSRDYRSPALGMSLLADVPAERKIFMLSHLGDGVSASLMGQDKHIYQPDFDRFERFDLASDPGELHDLSASLDLSEQEASINEMRKFVAAVNSWYKISDRAELARMRRKERPSVQKTLIADFGNALRLLGVNAKQKVKQNEYLDIELVFEVRGPPPSDKRFFLEQYQLFRSRPVQSLRDLNRLPVAQWLQGEWIVLPVQIRFSKELVELGKVMIELEFASLDGSGGIVPTASGGKSLPIRKAALQVLEIQIEAPSRL